MSIRSTQQIADVFQSDGRQSVTTLATVLMLLACIFGVAPAIPAANAVPDGMELTSVEVWPQRIELSQPWDVAQVLITGNFASGEQIDLTQRAKLIGPTDAVDVDKFGRVAPKADGESELVFEVEGKKLSVSVSVTGMNATSAVSYVQNVTPGLSKMGCNSGTCHGSKDGQAGFKLSLRGYDFLYDHRALTDDIGARRFNRANPQQSLMLLKASGSIAHVGGQLTQPGERYYRMLQRWIATGAKLDLDAPRVTGIRLVPENPIVPRPAMTQQMVVVATYSDGTERDVTADAFIESGDIEILSADPRGIVTTLRRGEAPILARYEGAYTATTVTIMGDRSGFEWKQPTTYNYIDDLVYDKLQRVKVEPADICTDEEFARRVYLDLTGLPPTAEQLRAFLSNRMASHEKRSRLVDQLVGSPSFVEHWTNKWSDLLQVNRKFLGELGSASLRAWIQDAIASNKPYDQFAHEILTATGSTVENPAAGYWKTLREPTSAMENTTHLFLAVRFNCNKCHDHPFERWTQDQYYNMTAFFAQVGLKEDPDYRGQRIGGSAVARATPLVEVVYDTGKGETTHDRTGQVSPPMFPYDTDLAASDGSRREQLAKWITSSENRYFASSYVNRLWGYLLGVGLIEPIDDIRAGNPPTNPELLQALTRDFVESGFDVQHMLRTICKSRVYQHSVDTTEWNEDDNINYSHALPRRLPAEVLYDAIHQVTGSESKLPGVPAGLRAAQLPDAGVSLPFLDDFGRPPRESSCECERTTGIVLGPIMKLVNGPTVNDAISNPANAISRLANEMDDDQLVREVFVRVLNRSPTAKELELGVASLQAAKEDVQLAESALNDFRQQRLAGLDDWLDSLSRSANWQTIVFSQDKIRAEHANLKASDDGSITASGPLKKDTYTLQWTAKEDGKSISGIRLDLLADESLPQGGPGRADNGNVVVSELEVSVRPDGVSEWTMVKLKNANASFSQDGWAAAGAIDGNPKSGWAISPQFKQANHASFETEATIELSKPTELQIKIQHQFDDGKHNLGKFRISTTDSEPPFTESKVPDEIAAIVQKDRQSWTKEELAVVEQHYLNADPEYTRLTSVLKMSKEQAQKHRLTGVQDLTWALINTPAFLFNR